ncbi:DUF7507 domain-containing protein, partial [Halomonas denitrificans]|nr:DUF11 domain-containing protein [Halomonas denitrificans]
MKRYSFVLLMAGWLMAIVAGSATAATVPESSADNDMDPCYNNDGWVNVEGSYDCVTPSGFVNHVYLAPPDGNNYGGGVQYSGSPGVQEAIQKNYTNLVPGETYAVEWYIMTDVVTSSPTAAEAWFEVTLCSDQQETLRLTPADRRIWFQQRLFFTADATSCNLTFRARNTTGDNASWVFLDGVSIGGSTSSDLAITKSGPASMPASGGSGTYSIGVDNNGPDATTSTVEVTDSLPSGVTVNGGAAGAVALAGPNAADWSCASDAGSPQIITCDSAAAFANGQSSTFTFTADFAPAADGTIVTNTASVQPAFGSGTQDPNGANDSSSAVTVYNAAADADLSVAKTGPATAVAGTQVTYDITVTNNGPADAADVSVADPTPAGYTFASATAPCAGGFPCALGTVSAGANVTIQVTFDIDPATTGDVTNTATVSTSTTDPDATNDSASATTTVVAEADMAITKTGPATAIAGTTATYSITVTNNGPSDAQSVTVDDPTPAGYTFSGATAPCGGGFPCALGMIAAGGSVAFDVTFSIAPSTLGDVTNTATVSSPTTDPNGANNASSATTTVGAEADLGITKTGPATAIAGTTATYSITVTNNGPSDAQSVTVDDPTPAGYTFSGATAPCGGGFPCALGTVAAGGSVAFDVTFSIAPSTLGDVTNTATVSSPTTDPNGANNASSATTTVGAEADLAITKTGPATAIAGTQVTYDITVTNNGPSDAQSVQVADPTPAGYTFA